MKRNKKLLELSDKCIEKLTIKAAKSKEKLFKPYAESILEDAAKNNK